MPGAPLADLKFARPPVLAAYLYAASIIFLVAIQIDGLLRKDASPHETGSIDLMRRGMGRAR